MSTKQCLHSRLRLYRWQTLLIQADTFHQSVKQGISLSLVNNMHAGYIRGRSTAWLISWKFLFKIRSCSTDVALWPISSHWFLLSSGKMVLTIVAWFHQFFLELLVRHNEIVFNGFPAFSLLDLVTLGNPRGWFGEAGILTVGLGLLCQCILLGGCTRTGRLSPGIGYFLRKMSSLVGLEKKTFKVGKKKTSAVVTSQTLSHTPLRLNLKRRSSKMIHFRKHKYMCYIYYMFS